MGECWCGYFPPALGTKCRSWKKLNVCVSWGEVLCICSTHKRFSSSARSVQMLEIVYDLCLGWAYFENHDQTSHESQLTAIQNKKITNPAITETKRTMHRKAMTHFRSGLCCRLSQEHQLAKKCPKKMRHTNPPNKHGNKAYRNKTCNRECDQCLVTTQK